MIDKWRERWEKDEVKHYTDLVSEGTYKQIAHSFLCQNRDWPVIGFGRLADKHVLSVASFGAGCAPLWDAPVLCPLITSFYNVLKEAPIGINLIPVDVSNVPLRTWFEHALPAHPVCANVTDLPFKPSSLDAGIALNLFNSGGSIDWMEEVLDEIFSLLAENGILIVSQFGYHEFHLYSERDYIKHVGREHLPALRAFKEMCYFVGHKKGLERYLEVKPQAVVTVDDIVEAAYDVGFSDVYEAKVDRERVAKDDDLTCSFYFWKGVRIEHVESRESCCLVMQKCVDGG